MFEAGCLTMAVALGITIFAWRSENPFTFKVALLYTTGCILGCVAIFGIIGNDEGMKLWKATLGAVFFAIYLLIDTILIMDGKAMACYKCEYLD